MPTYKLKDHVRADLVAYLSSLKGEIYRENPPWNRPDLMDNKVKRGEMLFNRVGCAGCHGAAGQGGYPNNNVVGGKILSLTYSADGYSKEEMNTLIHKGRISLPADPSQPAPMIRMPVWGDYLKEDEIDALVEYVFSLRPANQPKDDWAE
jgi:mono/diheme cytochrome c family protein